MLRQLKVLFKGNDFSQIVIGVLAGLSLFFALYNMYTLTQ